MENKTRRIFIDVLLTAGVTLVGLFLLKKLFFLILPVGAGYLFSEAVRSSFRKLKPVSLPVRRALIVLILMILFALLSLLAVLAAEKALKGVMALGEGLEGAVSTVSQWLQNGTARIGKWLSEILRRDVETQVANLLPALLTEGAKRVARVVPEWVGGIAAGLPLLVASLILFLFSGYYFSCEWDRARALFFRLCPEKKRAGVIKRKSAFLKALKKILRAYGLLFVITFCELLAGFWILRVPGSVGKALVTAVVDALPVFGCGTVLIPWGIVLLLRKQTVQGIGMLVLYGAMWVIRQFLEPRVVGRSVGLHPVVSLILVIGGLALFGIWGILLVPVVAAFLAETAADPPATEACRAGAGSRAPRGGKKADGKTA